MPAPATVKIIETVHIEADSAEFKSVVQRLTGKDSAAGGRRRSGGSGKEEAQGFVMYCSSPFADHSSKDVSLKIYVV
ncbi:hypothetical protein ABZP36_024614 [Zizania latifolia]